MRVLVVGDFLQSSGMTRYIFNVIGSIHDSKIKVDVLSISGSSECQKQVMQRGWGFYVVSPANGSLLKHLAECFLFFKHHAGSYDVIHFNETALWNFLPILFAHYFGKTSKIILNSHNTYFASNGKKVVLKTLEIMHLIGKSVISPFIWKRIAVSNEAAQWMFTKRIIRKGNFQIIPNGIRLSDFDFNLTKRQQIREMLGLVPNCHLYGNVGVLNKRKNQLRLIGIFKAIVQNDANAKLLLIGDGPDREKIMDAIERLGLKDRVISLRATNRVQDYYQAMDSIIMPSLNEGLSTVLLEAQTSGLTFFPASNIPLGNYISELVHPISLEETDYTWASIINQSLTEMSVRHSYLKEMQIRGYDTSSAANSIYQIYLEES